MLGEIGLRVRADIIVLIRLVERGDELDRVIQHGDDVWERVPEEPGNPHGDVDPGPVQLGQRDRSEVDDASRRVVPHRPDPSSANTSAMSSPAVRIAEVPHTDRPTDCGHCP